MELLFEGKKVIFGMPREFYVGWIKPYCEVSLSRILAKQNFDRSKLRKGLKVRSKRRSPSV